MPKNLNINKKLENPQMRALLKKMKAINSSDKDARNEAMSNIADELVMRSGFISAVQLSKEPVKDDSGNYALAPDTNISFPLLNDGHGRQFFPMFTESEEFEKWKDIENAYTIQMKFEDYASMLERNKDCYGLVLNPFSDNLLLPKPLVIRWFEQKQIREQGHANHVITKDTPVDVFVPNPYPMLLSNMLCEEAKNHDGIKAMWLRGIKLNGESGHLLVVDFTGDRNKIFGDLGSCAKKYLENKSLHIVSLDEGFGKTATENVLPIYSKN